MFPWESRRTRRIGRQRSRPELAALESLEVRQLLAFNALGTSLPSLTVSGYASPVTSWGGQVTVTINVANTGASTINEPLAQAIGSISSADAAAQLVNVYAVKSPRSFKGAVLIGSVTVPIITQNSFNQSVTTLNVPAQPTGFPGDGGTIYLVYRANGSGSVYTGNSAPVISKPIPVVIQAPLPQLEVVGLDLPPVIQPGDTVQPTIRITNIGPAATLPQGPVTVTLVASTSPFVNSGSTVVATYSVPNVPGASSISSKGLLLADVNASPPGNTVDVVSPTVITLPVSPKTYYLGVIIDPYNQLKELSKVSQAKHAAINPFVLIRKIGPPIKHLPPAGVVINGGSTLTPLFPIPLNNQPVGASPGTTFPTSLGGTITTPNFPPQLPGTSIV